MRHAAQRDYGRKAYKISFGEMKEREPLADTAVIRTIILKWISEKPDEKLCAGKKWPVTGL